MSKKFIPNGDTDFLMMARHFTRTIATEPARFAVSQEDCAALVAAVELYGKTYQAARGGGLRSQSQSATRVKDEAREQAERIIRRLRHVIAASESVDNVAKFSVGIRERNIRPKQLTSPPEPPRLRFVRALHESGATPVHELEFCEFHTLKQSRPEGVARLELFVDLIPLDEPIPAHPGENYGGRPWYLRSYTRSPIRLEPPMAREMMRVVYWGRWADSMGNVGPFSATAAAWMEGGSRACLPGAQGIAFGPNQPAPLLGQTKITGPAQRETTYRIAVIEAYRHHLNPHQVDSVPPLIQDAPRPQLEAPPASEAA